MGVFDLATRQQPSGPPPDPAFLAETRAPAILAGNIAVQTIGCLVFFMRIYSRLVIIKIWRPEDYILSVAWLLATGYSICQYGQVAHGAGRHLIANLLNNPQDPVESQKFAYAAQIVLLPALALPKISICCAYLRIFYTDKKGKWMIQALMVFLVLAIIPFNIEIIVQCKPIHVYWTEGHPANKCVNDIAGFYTSGVMNALADMALMAIVLPKILELQLHARQRYALIGITLLGSLAIVAAIVRMVKVGTMLALSTFDPSWDSYTVSIWTSTEIYVALICASAPGIKPFVSKVLPKLLGSSLLSKSKTANAGHSYEMGSRWKRSTPGNSKVHRQTSETALASGTGPWTEIESGRGVDAESIGDKHNPSGYNRRGSDSEDGAIYKTSEIRVQTTNRHN